MTEYASNSHNKKKAPPEEVPDKQITKVIEGEVIRRRKPLGRRFKDTFFGGDFKDTAHYVAADVLLPAFRNLLFDAITKSVERAVYGEDGGRRPATPPQYAGRTQYNRPPQRYSGPFGAGTAMPKQAPHHPLPNRQSEAELILHSRGEADQVVEGLLNILEQYEVASVADLNELVGLPTTHVDNKWGWTSLAGIGVRQVREGYALDIPPVEQI